MTRIGKNNKKGVAAFFLGLLALQNLYPVAAYALTSGPSQPEMQKFQPAGTSDMVDLFSGDFKYDIPLLDVGGYPVNLSYHCGGSMEDEAGWTGMNWSLNPGVMNRTMRGIPDDFSGNSTAIGDPPDLIQTVQSRKNFKKIGGQLVLKPTILAWEFGSASLHLGVYKDNYFGIGGQVGASLSFNTGTANSTTLTAGLGLNSDSREGVTLNPSFALSSNYEDCKELNNGALSGGFSYNTRQGLKEVDLGQSFSFNSSTWNEAGYETGAHGASFGGLAAFTKYFGHTFTPTFYTNTSTQSTTFNLDLGPAIFGGYIGIGGSGYVYSETNTQPQTSVPAYGYLNYSAGKNNPAALLDFNREKDGPFLTTAPAIPIPVATEDYFEATSQAGAQQFRPFYNGNYITFDRAFSKNNSTLGGGLTLGSGNLVQGGARVDISGGQALTHKWTANNNYLTIADPGPYTGSGSQVVENTYFKQVGEQTKTDPAFYSLIGNDVTEKVAINSRLYPGIVATTQPVFQSATATRNGSAIQRQNRDVRTATFSYLNARQASAYGLDKLINGVPRVDAVHKPHHISEITVTDKGGKRMIYGIPVYNTDEEEVSFSVAAPANTTAFNASRKSGLISYAPGVDNSVNNGNGRENIYNRKSIPPYATSYLLTGILSSDYVDKTGDGISDDDLGTAIKFNYNKLNSNYNWRAPYEASKANYNEGFISDPKDDKANYVFGTKEIWYLQSIGSKTMVAQFFTSDRQDGLGVSGESGGQGTSMKLQKLDSIRLLSKADLQKNGTNAIPIKVVHFEYDYSLYPGVPNNSGVSVMAPDPANPGSNIDLNAAKGKLTLKKVYFTFGASSRGKSNPYVFAYDTRLIRDGSIANLPAQTGQDPNEAADLYTQRQSDRWGTYKQSFYNPPNGQSVLNNSEFPYSLQVRDAETYDERQLADRFASKWQLNTITTPAGGIISVEYESDDYAYVQDRKAMVMCSLAGVGSNGSSTGMINASKLYVTVPVAVNNTTDFINTYLSGPNGQNWSNVFFKIYTDMDNKGHSEFVPGYAEIDYTAQFDMVDAHTVGIPVKMVNGYDPVSKTAWQLLQDDLPQYAYENYDNSDVNSLSGDAEAAVRTIVQSFANLKELFQSFDKTASGDHYANKIDLSRSMIRLNYPVGKVNGASNAAKHTYGKLGGGRRVRKVEISDEWDHMTGTSGVKRAVYGVQYDYTTTDDNNNIISSGVAAYEPEIGNEENPFHEPLNYTEKVEWGSDRYHYMEKPFGESYFPAPSVGYSQVKVTGYGADYSGGGAPVIHSNTGYTINAFYTARDFPTQVDYLPLEEENYEDDLTLFLFASQYINRVTTSQGFKVIVNDMHGKLRSTKVYDMSGTLISSVENFYNVSDANAQQQQLNNTVPALDTDGTIPQAGMLLGTDAELVTDVRESTNTNAGTSIGIYAGVFDLIWPIPYAAVNYNRTVTTQSYNSVSAVKVIHQYGILKQVRTTQNGSTLTAVNLLWDAQTGDVLLTQNQNEFDAYTYAWHYPAYMAYDGMGSAYKNIGAVFTGFATGSDGKLSGTGTQYLPYLSPGDVLVNIDPGSTRGWILQSQDGSLRFIDQSGNFITGSGTYMIIRSGRRNLLDASAGTVISTTNPLVLANGSYQVQVGVDKNILDAKSLLYKDEWGTSLNQLYTAVSTYQDTQTDCLSNLLETSLEKVLVQNQFYTRRGFFALQSDGLTAADFLGPNFCGVLHPGAPQSYLSTQDPSQYPFYQNQASESVFGGSSPLSWKISNGATAQIGGYQIVFDQVSSDFITLANSPMSESDMTNELNTGYTFNGTNGTGSIPKYCLINQSPGSWIFRRTNSINIPDNTIGANDLDACGNYPQYATYETLLTFHIVGITITQYGCVDPLNSVINPYYLGIKGDWRPDHSYAYQVNRVQVPGATGQTGGTNIRTSGYYSTFTPFWIQAGHTLTLNSAMPGAPDPALSDNRWVWANHPVHFDQKGNEIENVDALKRYSSALYGYQQSVATAVAANARQNEIAFDGFEDYYFSLPVTATDPCPSLRHLDMGFTLQGGSYCSSGNCIISDPDHPPHSGNYCLNLSGAISISKPAGTADPGPNVIGFDATGRCILLSNEQAAGFAPVPNKQYLLSVWVNDGNAGSNKISGFQININGTAVDLSNLTVPVVEGWKKLDVPFTAGAGFTMQMTGGANIYIDDLRLFPFDAQLKTFVYDDQSMRLMGQLDENNFGVFYEYDDEGTPVRIKKETEKGVMTIKENRQSLRQSQ